MPGLHATLSPSASERWISCPASVRMGEKIPPAPDSPYAAEGTAAHALGELAALHSFGKITIKEYNTRRNEWRKFYDITSAIEAEMVEHVKGYARLLKERAAVHPNTQLLVEQRVDTGLPHCWGTSDAILVSPRHIEIVDLKYGMGIAVEAEGNSQLRLYGVGALEGYGDLLGDPEVVYMTVYQPRLNHTLTAEMPAEELRAWRDSLRPVAELALTENAPFGPSEIACRWCPASGHCPAQLEYATKLDFGSDPDLLSEAELAEALAQVPHIRDWLNALEATALRVAYSEGKSLPGYKVVLSGSRRVIDNDEDVISVLDMLGYDRSQTANVKLKGIGELEKLLGKEFNTVLGEWIRKTEGKPSIVAESDRRPAINPASQAGKEFGDE